MKITQPASIKQLESNENGVASAMLKGFHEAGEFNQAGGEIGRLELTVGLDCQPVSLGHTMKVLRSNHKGYRGLTLVEVMVVIFSLFILAVLLLPALSAPRIRNTVNCMSQLKHMGLDFRVWEGDHRDKYPMSVSVTNGGASEAAERGNAVAVFQSMSNELGSTRILVCPADKSRLPASSFRTLTSKNVSYFINVAANEANPQEIMTGDDNLEIRGVRVKSGLLVITNNVPIGWTADRHRLHGNLGLADGSVQSETSWGLAGSLNSTNGPALRLAIP